MTALLVLSLITNVIASIAIGTLLNQRHVLEQENASHAKAWLVEIKEEE